MKIFIFFLILILNTFCNYSFSAEVNKKDLNGIVEEFIKRGYNEIKN